MNQLWTWSSRVSVADVGRLGVGAGDLGRDLDALVLAEEVVEPSAQGQDLVHRVVEKMRSAWVRSIRARWPSGVM